MEEDNKKYTIFFYILFVELPPANHFSFIFWSNLFVIFLFVEIGGKDWTF